MSSANKLLQAASGGAGDSVYVEDVFSTDLWDGDGSSETVTNGIDFSGEGGLVWEKRRSTSGDHILIDTVRGGNKAVFANDNSAEYTNSQLITSFNSNGYALGSYAGVNQNGETHVGWSFRKQAGFFDVVTYTGDGTSSRDIAHSLGSKPGFIITKRTNLTGNWTCYHIALGYEERTYLDLTNAKSTNSATWVQEPTATHFTVGSENTNGDTYIAYLFAHNDQSFGDDSDESIIKCGSYTEPSSGSVSINLGFEPQWVLAKPSSTAGDWYLFDMMRGMPVSPATARLSANSSAAEVVATSSSGPWPLPTATGFDWKSGFVGNETWIYIAIRRPMKTPDYGTEVFTPLAYAGNATADRVLASSNSPVSLGIVKLIDSGGGDWLWADRLRGKDRTLYSNYTQSESTTSNYITGFDVQSGIEVGSHNSVNGSSKNYISYMLTRAAKCLDIVAYTGNGSAGATQAHNLGVVPELMIVKARTQGEHWPVYASGLNGGTTPQNYSVFLSANASEAADSDIWNNTAPTSSVFTVGGNDKVNRNTDSYIAYLFATLSGVSKVGSVVHSGTTNVDCGFSAGARLVVAKRTDSTGDWFVWDSASGIVAGNDPYVRFNTSDPYVSSADFIDPLASGFTLTSSFTAGTYIFLAIA